MAAKTLKDIFTDPLDIEAKIWRYLSIERFEGLIKSSKLYFRRSDKFDDPFEGSLPLKDVEIRNKQSEEISERLEGFTKTQRMDWLKKSSRMMENLHRQNRENWFVNCWHMNEFESAAMWSLYGNLGKTISIQSKYSLFKELLPDESNITIVRYIDFNNDRLKKGGWNTAEPLTTKRLSYEHEKEIRALIHRNDTPEYGIEVNIELRKLILDIRIHPNATDDDFEYTKILLKANGFNPGILHKSEMNRDPIF